MTDNFLHFTDLHVARSASYRVDDIMEALRNKFKQIRGYINEHNIKACFISGDIFNSNIGNRIPYDVVTEFIELIQSLKVPVYGIPGNHDMYMGSIDKHPLKTLFQSGVITRLTKEPTHITGYTYAIGFDHKYEKNLNQFQTKSLHDSLYKSIAAQKIFMIGLTHLVLGKEPGMYYSEPVYGIEEFKECAVDLFLNGHIHTPLGPLRNTYGQVFCQPGALRRTNTASEEMCRVPLVTFFSVENSKLVDVKYLPIECNPDVFVNWKRDIKKQEKEKVNKFIESVSNIRTADTTDIYKIIEESTLSSEVREILLEHLS